MPDTNYHYPDYAIKEKIQQAFRKAGAYAVQASAGKVVTIKALLKQWSSIINKIPGAISRTARHITNPGYQPYGVGAAMLRSMGWKEGTSLGKRPGIISPIDTPTGTKGRAGLGAKPKHNHKTKRAQREAKFKVIRRDGELIYGTYQPSTHTFSIYSLATNGTPHFAHQTLTIEPRFVRDVCWWNKGITGPAVLTYPHPRSWLLCGPDVTLNSVTVKHLTLAYRLPKQVTPSCVNYWDNLLGYVDWSKIGCKYREPFYMC